MSSSLLFIFIKLFNEASSAREFWSFLLDGRYLSQVEVKFLLKAWKRTKLSLVYMHLGCNSFSQGFLRFIDLMFRRNIYTYIYKCIYYNKLLQLLICLRCYQTCWYVPSLGRWSKCYLTVHKLGDVDMFCSVVFICQMECANFRVTIWYQGFQYRRTPTLVQ